MSIVLYLSIVICSVVQSVCVKYSKGANENGVVFNAIKALSALLLFGILCIGGASYDGYTLACGAGYGVALAVSMYAGYEALLFGPMALTSTIVSFSVVIPVLFGMALFGEEITWLKGGGFVCLILALLFAGKKKAQKQEKMPALQKQTNAKWGICVAVTFLANGVCSVLQKLHQSKRTGLYSTEFMLFAMLACCAIYCTVTLIKNKPKTVVQTTGKRFAMISGLSNAIVNYFTLILAGFENASVLFPTISVGTIFATSVCGVILFREKMTWRHIAAITFGVAAIVCLKL